VHPIDIRRRETGSPSSQVTRVETRSRETVLALVTRLARPHPSGGRVIERAAILAEGADFKSVIGWIVDHGGKPEAASATRAGGLHGTRLHGGGTDSEPRRFVLPPGELP
jgi:hypothetical protein